VLDHHRVGDAAVAAALVLGNAGRLLRFQEPLLKLKNDL